MHPLRAACACTESASTPLSWGRRPFSVHKHLYIACPLRSLLGWDSRTQHSSFLDFRSEYSHPARRHRYCSHTWRQLPRHVPIFPAYMSGTSCLHVRLAPCSHCRLSLATCHCPYPAAAYLGKRCPAHMRRVAYNCRTSMVVLPFFGTLCSRHALGALTTPAFRMPDAHASKPWPRNTSCDVAARSTSATTRPPPPNPRRSNQRSRSARLSVRASPVSARTHSVLAPRLAVRATTLSALAPRVYLRHTRCQSIPRLSGSRFSQTTTDPCSLQGSPRGSHSSHARDDSIHACSPHLRHIRGPSCGERLLPSAL
ncbi:hypothetical protein C8J57DRAFT_106892 [Mycena rebaudengoi]|nr:hypothetical protein C8J57DRAFT_106892 [Mycena rebaudengoi]